MCPRSPRGQCRSGQGRKAGIMSNERHWGLIRNMANLTHVSIRNHREAAVPEHINTQHLIPLPPLANEALLLEPEFWKDFTILPILWSCLGHRVFSHCPGERMPWTGSSQLRTFSLIFSASLQNFTLFLFCSGKIPFPAFGKVTETLGILGLDSPICTYDFHGTSTGNRWDINKGWRNASVRKNRDYNHTLTVVVIQGSPGSSIWILLFFY